MNCPKCGNELKPNMKFCAKCGTAVSQSAQPTPVTPRQSVTPQPQNLADAKLAKQKKAEKSGKKNIALRVIATILVIATLLTGGLFITDSILFKTEKDKGNYITDFPVLKQNTDLLVYDEEKFPYEDYNIKVDRFKTGKVFKSSTFSSFENVINERSSSKIFNIDFEEDGKYQITLEGIVSSRTQAVPTAPSSETTTTTAKPEETTVIVIIVIVDDDNEEAVDKVTLDSKAGDKSTESTDKNSPNQNDDSSKTTAEFNLLKETYYNSDGSINRWYECEYDANDNRIKVTSYNFEGSVNGWEKYEYDVNDNVIKGINYNIDNSISYWYVFEYDSNGNRIKHIRYKSDGNVDEWYEYEYDANGNTTKQIEHNPYVGIVGWSEYQYDENGDLIKVTRHFDDGRIFYYNVLEYDTDGNNIKNTCYGDDDRIGNWTELEYDTNGNMIKETYYNPDGSIDYWYEYEYIEIKN